MKSAYNVKGEAWPLAIASTRWLGGSMLLSDMSFSDYLVEVTARLLQLSVPDANEARQAIIDLLDQRIEVARRQPVSGDLQWLIGRALVKAQVR